MADSPSQHLQCMEVWGGSKTVDRAVQLGGLDAWVFSKPFQAPAELALASAAATSASAVTTRAPVTGGDIYYASSCATGRIHRVLLADVAGHGDAVTETAEQLRTLMRQYINYLDQKQFVRAMNRRFLQVSADGAFATALVTTYFAPNRLLSICNAGHPRPMLYRAADQKWSLLEHVISNEGKSVRNIPLGILEITDYEQFDVPLNMGDWVLCYTDALIEAKGADGEFIGEQGLLELTQSIPSAEPRAFIEALLSEIQRLHPANLQDDDVTVMLLRPSLQRVRFWQKVKALARMAAQIVGNCRPGGRPPVPDLQLPNIGGAMFPGLSRRWRGSQNGFQRRATRSVLDS